MIEELNFQFHTFGCKVNTYDTGLLERQLAGQNQSQPIAARQAEIRQVHILNSCAVTSEATREALRLARRLKLRDPHAVVVLTGCAAQVDTERAAQEGALDLVVANSHKMRLREIIADYLRQPQKPTPAVFKSNIFQKVDLEAGGGWQEHRTRSFLKIQDGCNSFCTYCVIPFARGKSRSIPISSLIAKIKELTASAVKEVVLTGVHIGDYQDTSSAKPKGLEDLIEAVLAQTSMPRLRLTSLEPIELSSRLMDLFKDPRLCPHFHMSIQSACTGVLSQMKRNYDRAKVEQALELISATVPEAFVGMDVIAGFPSETDQQFLETYRSLSECPWTRIHVFPYSPRPGTYAGRMTPLSPQVVSARAARLRELSHSRFQAAAARQMGRRKRVLFLKNPKSSPVGLSRDYWSVRPEAEGLRAEYLKAEGLKADGLRSSIDFYKCEWEVEVTGVLQGPQSSLGQDVLLGRLQPEGVSS